MLAAGAAGLTWPAGAAENKLVFTAAGKEFHFDTGALRGTLRGDGRSKGLFPLHDGESGNALGKINGVFSHYRLLDNQARYGTAAWDWVSEAKLLDCGDVEVSWTADKDHPFDMMAVYHWVAPNTLDLFTRLTARKELRGLEIFLASYFEGFPTTSVYAKDPAAGGKPAFLAANKSAATWHMFPRDEEAVKMIQDGRWKRPPHPVEWTIRPVLAAPLAVRRDAVRGMAAVIMARAADCFAVAVPHDEEGHRSVYLSLFGRDFKPGESAEARTRLVIGRGITDEKVMALYDVFRNQQIRT